MFKWVNLFDLDDTVINSNRRSKFHENGSLDVEHWNENNRWDKICEDHVIFNMGQVLHYFMQRDDCWNIAVTSRELTDIDYIYFKTHNIMFDDTLHRGSCHLGKDYSNRFKLPDYELKDILLTNYLGGSTLNPTSTDPELACYTTEYKQGFAFDDNQYNLDVFTKHGYQTFDAKQINQNAVCYTDIIQLAEQNLT